MNTSLEAALVVLVVVLVLPVVLLVPVFLQLRRAVKNLNAVLETINHRLPVILKNLEELSANLNTVSSEVKGGVEQVSSGLKKAQAAMSMLAVVKPLVYSKVPAAMTGKLWKLMALFRGIKVFLNVLQEGRGPAVKTEEGGCIPVVPPDSSGKS